MLEKPSITSWEYGEYEFVLRLEDEVPGFPSDGAEDLVSLNAVLDGGEDLNGDSVLNFGRGVFLPGVIEVYPLGNFVVPEEF